MNVEEAIRDAHFKAITRLGPVPGERLRVYLPQAELQTLFGELSPQERWLAPVEVVTVFRLLLWGWLPVDIIEGAPQGFMLVEAGAGALGALYIPVVTS